MAQFGSSTAVLRWATFSALALKKGQDLSDLTGAAPRGRASSTYRKARPLNRAGSGPSSSLRPRRKVTRMIHVHQFPSLATTTASSCTTPTATKTAAIDYARRQGISCVRQTRKAGASPISGTPTGTPIRRRRQMRRYRDATGCTITGPAEIEGSSRSTASSRTETQSGWARWKRRSWTFWPHQRAHRVLHGRCGLWPLSVTASSRWAAGGCSRVSRSSFGTASNGSSRCRP